MCDQALLPHLKLRTSICYNSICGVLFAYINLKWTTEVAETHSVADLF